MNSAKTPSDTISVPEIKRSMDYGALLKSAALFATGTMLSRILGLIRDVFIARHFSNDVRDAFLNAFRLPNLFRRLLGEGTLSVSFIPVFIDLLKGRSNADPRVRALVGGVFSILLTVSMTVSLLAIIFMEDILRFLLDGAVYMSIPGKFALTVELARIMFCFLIVISLYGYFMAILNGLQKFAITALAPCLFNLSVITAAWLSARFQFPERALAVSVLVGGFLQMVVLIPQVVASGFFPKLTFHWESSDIGRVLRVIVPSVFALSLLQTTALVNIRFAAGLQSGSHSFLYLADRLLELPVSLLAVSLGSVLLPTLAKLWSEKREKEMVETMNHMLRLVVFLALPAAVGLFVLAQPITETLFLGRQFTYENAVLTAGVIRVYSALVVLYGISRIIGQGFYAVQKPWFPALAAATALFSHVVFAYALTQTFGLLGLASASICSAAVNVAMLAIGYNARVGSLQVKTFLLRFIRYVICAAAMVGILTIYQPLVHIVAGHFPGARATSMAITILASASVYLLVAFIVRLPEARETWALLVNKIRAVK